MREFYSEHHAANPYDESRSSPTGLSCIRFSRCVALLLLWWGVSVCAAAETNLATIMVIENIVETQASTNQPWNQLLTNNIGWKLYPGNRVRTGPNSGATLLFYDHRVLRMNEDTIVEILVPRQDRESAFLGLKRGLMYLFSRSKPFEGNIRAGSALAATKGTEFVISYDDQLDRTRVVVLEGEVILTNDFGFVEITNGYEGIAIPGTHPTKTAVINTTNIIQWCLYYPAVLDLRELPLTAGERKVLDQSLTNYASGDLLAALASYPSAPQAASDAERVYYAALLLSVGKVQEAESILTQLSTINSSDPLPRLATVLRTLIAAVRLQPLPFSLLPSSLAPLASELLAESYYRQSQAGSTLGSDGRAARTEGFSRSNALSSALDAARKATKVSPNFSFAWSRLAELEFSFGHIREARIAIDRSLQLAHRNAEALSLKGFLLAADNHTAEAIDYFNQAITVDGALGNAWLGRGLCKFRIGSGLLHSPFSNLQSALEDLETAAALEPNRSFLRSYLGKAWSENGNDLLAPKELERAINLDPRDPTPWLYSALMKQQQNRVNEAIADLEQSSGLNDNQALFRSRLLLDQDRAVRSANLASIYRDAGMTEVSVREAASAVTYDYANESAHLFLSDSYNELRDPTRFNLRYQTVWFNELLLANLLSPVGGGRLSQHVSQQEYSRLFQADGLGFASSTLVRTDGRVQQLASQFGTFGGTSYALDLDYEHNDGVRLNNDLDSIEWYTTAKQQITPQDTALVLVKYQDYHSGDKFQYYNPTNASRHFRFDEYQKPVVLGGWHHEWSPGIHTILLGGRLENDQYFREPKAYNFVLERFSESGEFDPGASSLRPFGVNYHGELEIYTTEINQIFQWSHLTLCAGARYQWGDFDTRVTLTNPPGPFAQPIETTRTSADFERITGYGYLTVEPLDRVWLTGGLVYEDITFPHNFRHPPISDGEDHRSLFGPKGGLVWEPVPQLTVRGLYAKSLGGVSLDDSYRLEPTQLAGFPQAFRNLIPESVVGSIAAPEYQTYGGALDLKFPSGTYAGLQYERLESKVRQTVGYFVRTPETAYMPQSTPETLDYREDSFIASLNQLLGKDFVVGATYKFSHAQLHDAFPQIPAPVLQPLLPDAYHTVEANLHEASGYILFNHSSGFFARAETHWYHQNNSGYQTPLPGDDFFQHNLFAGYRFWHRRAEVLLGILNLTDQDYRLNPLNVYSELPRERTFMARLQFQF